MATSAGSWTPRSRRPQASRSWDLGEIGFRNITNNVRPVKVPADLKGLKLRTPGSKTRILAFEMLGASPISMNIGEIYMGLQQGVVDGQENPLGTIRAFSWFEVQKYISLSRHVYTPITFVMNLRKYQSLTDAQRAAVDRAALRAVGRAGSTAPTTTPGSLAR